MAGMGLDVNFVLEAVSFPLLEKIVERVFPDPIVFGLNTVSIVDPGIYVGAMLIAGNPELGSEEIIQVLTISETGFTANFVSGHDPGERLRGATFSGGQVIQSALPNISSTASVAPLFTQAEMLGYCHDVQNDMLERIRPTFFVSEGNPIAANNPVVTPLAASIIIRIERVAIEGLALWNATQSEIDMSSQDSNQGTSPTPNLWYQDHVATGKLAVAPKPSINLAAELIFSEKEGNVPVLSDALVIPDIFWYGLKYGILAVAFAKDGEMRDARRAAVCAKRYERVVAYGKKFMRSVQVEPDFSKLARAGVA